jgi:hypothetical protein
MRYQEFPAALAAMVTAAVSVLCGCASVKPVVATINDIASALCKTAPAIKAEAERRRISVDELCAVHSVAQPFLEQALRAQRVGSERSGVAPRSAAECEPAQLYTEP